MKKSFLPNLTAILIFPLFPYAITILINGGDAALLDRAFNVESILPVVTMVQIDSHYELEAIKAQVIIARSNIYRQMQEQQDLRQVFWEIRDAFNENVEKNTASFLYAGSKYEKAVAETTGEVLALENELKLLPYHEISAGKTRDGVEVLHSADYEYLKSVNSSVDKDAENFLNSVYIDQNLLTEDFSIETRDSAGYVTELLADGNILEAESFRKGMGLTSANFTIQRTEDEVRFLCKGRGHGLGFSQYGGNALAQKHKTGEEILEYYFPEMEIVDIHEVLL